MSFLVSTANWRYDTPLPNSLLAAKSFRRSHAPTEKDFDAIYRFLSQCLRSIIQPSPTSSLFRAIGSLEHAALYEEVIQPQYILDFDFDLIDAERDMEWPSWCNVSIFPRLFEEKLAWNVWDFACHQVAKAAWLHLNEDDFCCLSFFKNTDGGW